jgi:hypothetical protein
MGQLIPEDFPLDQLANDAEREVVAALCNQLMDSWFIIPSLDMRGDTRDREADIVLLHHDLGVVLIEVKGHRMAIRDGVWVGEAGRPLKPQPVDQARGNAYALRDRLRELPGLERLQVEYGIALPNTRSIDGQLPMEIDAVQVLMAGDLQEANTAIEDLALSRHHSKVLDDDQMEGIVEVLCPDVTFSWDPQARVSATRLRLHELCEAQINVLKPLAQNRRVVVRGAAGTGKTRLAIAWALQAWAAGERVLVTCFNDPLAEQLRNELPQDEDDQLLVGPFLRLALELPGMPPLAVPPDADASWWDTVATGHIHKHWPLVGPSFDTIVIDEAQDFSPAWIAQLKWLLDPDGPRRMLMLADEGQGLYTRGFRFPDPDDGWVRAELVANCRNAEPIARILRRKLGGAPAPAMAPEGLGVSWRGADDPDAVVALVDAELERLTDEGRDMSGVCVATFHSALRDRLRSELDLCCWEDRDSERVLCENVHRLKGLEFDTVILATDVDEGDLALLYVGISRAVSELIVVGPTALTSRLGLERG